MFHSQRIAAQSIIHITVAGKHVNLVALHLMLTCFQGRDIKDIDELLLSCIDSHEFYSPELSLSSLIQ